MRLLFISQGYPPVDGGIATSTRRIAQSLTCSGMDITVCTFDYSSSVSGPDTLSISRDGDISIARIGPFPRHERVDPSQAAILRRRAFDQIQAITSTSKPDLVMSFYAAGPGLLGSHLASSIGVPHIIGLRGNDVGRNMFSNEWLPVLDHIVRRCASAICVNQYVRERLLYAFPEVASKTCIIENAVDISGISLPAERRHYLRTNTSWDDASCVVAFIGTPREKKGIRILLEAIHRCRVETNIRLLVCGPSLPAYERAACGTLWDELHRDHMLHFTGQQPREMALAIASEADIVVMPSLEDGLANGLLEGMALGICPVASDIFANVIADRQNGMVIRRNSASDLTAALQYLANDKTRRQELGGAARSTVEVRYRPELEAHAYMAVFDALLKGTYTLSNAFSKLQSATA